MKVGLFIPCYVNLYYPNAGMATLRMLEKAGCHVIFPQGQTCCGQPLSNAGMHSLTKDVNNYYKKLFSEVDYIVGPSASCCLHLREHVFNHSQGPEVYEVCSFLTDILHVEKISSDFHGKVALHQGCHGLRGLGIAQATEEMVPHFSKPQALIEMVKGVTLVETDRWDECCGFGGAFSVGEEAVSVRMGTDKIDRIINSGADYIGSTDMSCLMHLQGLLLRRRSNIQVRHITEILCHEA
jgi:L-lactate dehydrogenase complex protein LldE